MEFSPPITSVLSILHPQSSSTHQGQSDTVKMSSDSSDSKGITTRLALQRLKASMMEAQRTTSPSSWFWTMLLSPAQFISLALTILCGILLLIAGGLGSKVRLVEIVEGSILVVLGLFNLVIHMREVYVLENFTTMKVKRTVSHVSGILRSFGDKDAVSLEYPSNEMVTNRGYFTTPTLRDGRLVHVPNNLLVEGDVVQLGPDRPAPAELVPISENGSSSEDGPPTIKEGQKISFLFFEKESESVSFVSPLNKLFKVSKSPFIKKLNSILEMKQSPSLLNNEISASLKFLLYVFVFIILGTTFLFNVIRFAALPNDFSPWYQMLLTQTVYVVLPVLFFNFPIFRACVNAYGTTSVHKLCSSYSSDVSVSFRDRRGDNFFKNLLQVLCLPFHYAGWRLFHVLGSTTTLCCIDKEYVLCHPRPVPDKVFFLNCQKEDQKATVQSVPSPMEAAKDREEQIGSHEDSQCSVFHSCSSLPLRTTPERQMMGSRSGSKSEEALQEGVPKTMSHDKRESASLHVTFKDFANSSTSLDENVNINTEILGLSSRPEDPGEIFFDDINWRDFLDSIKAVGFSGVTMSHLVQQFNFTTAETLSSSLLQDLQATDCLCSLGKEIGVTDYAINTFEPTCKSILSVCPHYSHESTYPTHSSSKVSQLWNTTQSEGVSLLYMFTALFKVAGSSSLQLVTRSHSDFALACCQDFWNGSDIIPLSLEERKRIRDFFARRSLLAHAVVLSYNPFLESEMANLPEHSTLVVPHNHLLTVEEETPLNSLEPDIVGGNTKGTVSASELFQIQRGQIFLGVVSLQHQPYQDVVSLIEDLGKAGIRFVHFSAESELRENVFSERMGLETGWNCHISLADDSSGRNKDTDSLNSDLTHSISRSSSDSSFGQYMQGKTSYIRAKLPRGVDNIRPHLENVDNVPLLVPLFTDCQPDGIYQMIQIMQENGEVVSTIGNAWNSENLLAFSQSDVSIGLVPGEPGLKCLADLCSENWNRNNTSAEGGLNVASAHDLATELNTLPCQIILPRHAEVSIMEIVSTSRHILSCTRHSLLLSLGLSVSLALLLLLATVFFLPPPLSGSQLFHFILFTIPILAVWMLSVKADPAIKKVVMDKNKVMWSEKWRFLVYFMVTFFPTSVVSVLIFGLSVQGLCSALISDSNSINGSGTCHLLLGNRNETSQWNGWDGSYKPELLVAQGLNSIFLSLCTVVFSLRFLHRTAPLWRLYRFVPIYQFVLLLIVPSLHIAHALGAYFVAVESCRGESIQRVSLGAVPWYVWVFCTVWLAALCPILELTKRHDRKVLRKAQRFLRLEFETKLGMNSPF